LRRPRNADDPGQVLVINRLGRMTTSPTMISMQAAAWRRGAPSTTTAAKAGASPALSGSAKGSCRRSRFRQS
jgi:hypothetical protein